MTFNWQMDSENVVHMHYGILSAVMKIQSMNGLWREMCGSRKDHTEWGNPKPERQILNVHRQMKFLAPNLQMWVLNLE